MSNEKRSYREIAGMNWTTRESEAVTREVINTGCLLKIADAADKMARSIDGLIRSLDYSRREVQELTRQRTALRGKVTKLQRQLERTNSPQGGTQ